MRGPHINYLTVINIAYHELSVTTVRRRFAAKKGKDVDLYSAFHAPGTPNAHTSLKLTRQTAIRSPPSLQTQPWAVTQ